MNHVLRIPLNLSPDQSARLAALQLAFSEVCNALAPTVQQSRVWNRVALHHMAYKALRERFPHMGSQMVCNAIYSVSRHARIVYQDPRSPAFLGKLGDRPLPLIRFAPNCPVYFDRHTLSLKDDQLSMYTMNGRIRFQLSLSEADRRAFHDSRLREVVLSREPSGRFVLAFSLSDDPAAQAADGAAQNSLQIAAPEPDPVSPPPLHEVSAYVTVESLNE